jgi:hypothetical protein
MLRVFEAGDFKDLLTPAPNPRLEVQGNLSTLTWDTAAGGGYRVEFSAGLDPFDWQLQALSTNNIWTNAVPLPDPTGFFRVFVRP